MKIIHFFTFFISAALLHFNVEAQDSLLHQSLDWLQKNQEALRYQQRDIDSIGEYMHTFSFQFDDWDIWDGDVNNYPGVVVIDSIFNTEGDLNNVWKTKTPYQDLKKLDYFEQIESYQDSLSSLMVLPLPTELIPVYDAEASEDYAEDAAVVEKYAYSTIDFAFTNTNNDRNENRETVLRAITHLMTILKGEPAKGMMNAPILELYKSLPDELNFEEHGFSLTADLVDFDKIRLTEIKDGAMQSFAFYLWNIDSVSSTFLNPENKSEGESIELKLNAAVEVTKQLEDGISVWVDSQNPSFIVPDEAKAEIIKQKFNEILNYSRHNKM